MSLEKALESAARSRAARAKAPESAPTEPAASPKPIQALASVRLPAWPEAVRALPNGFLRSALFGAGRSRKGPRRYLQRERIAALDGIEILYTGERLDQGDSHTYQAALHITRCQEMGRECRFSAYAILKLLGKTDTGGNRDTLDNRLLRLKVTGVEVKQGRFTYIGSLIDEVYKDEVTKEYVIILNEKLRVLFEDKNFTLFDWEVYNALKGKPLAQWLHCFYSSHAKPYPITIAALHKLCGSEAKEIWKYAQTLRTAFDDLSQVSTDHGKPLKHKITGDIVQVERTPTASQRRHLRRREKLSTGGPQQVG